MIGITARLTLCAFTLLSTASYAKDTVRAPYVPDSGSIALRCGLLIDGIGDAAIPDRLVLIRDGRIASISPGKSRVPASTKRLDLSAYTCLPGLIDTHTHITDHAGETRDLSIYYKRSIDEERRISRTNAEITLFAGFTTVRNVGAYSGWSGRDIRDHINAGQVAGPRVQTAGFYLTIPGGGGDLVIPGIPEENIPFHVRMGVARGADAFRKKAEAAVAGGADVLKIIASGAVLAYGGIPGSPEMTPEEIAAVVEVGHAAGIKVTAHAHGAQSIKESILAGADSIEHASLADDEAIALAAERQVAFSMDVYNGDYIATVGREQGWPEEFLRKNDETVDVQREVFKKAYKAGVPIIYGTDSAVYPHGDNALQFAIMVGLGMAPMDAIKTSTSVAAEYIGWQDDVGAIEHGRFGDLIAVKGNPLEDITVLQKVSVVVKGGLVFKMPAEASN
ncbi:MAG: amidohydrolase family protein [Gammaproteobacteria bacterium]|nr:amidohydrolase family protein [Gammaproteobacteria bacterium]MDH4315340.1 amidohydrolase family protein [Gammaproteobacteria bacterium]MDH5215429.1 amidohydrolase family protein [Gammaproteobacteria bacterium]